MDVRHVVFMSDLHIGSSFGPMPDEFEDSDGVFHRPSALQQWINQQWRIAVDEFIPAITEGEPFALVLNGDLIDGDHHGTRQLVVADPEEQADMAVEFLTPLCQRASCVYAVRGTEAHCGKSCLDEHSVARSLKVSQVGRFVRFNEGSKVYSAWQLSFKLGPFRMMVRHHIGGTKNPRSIFNPLGAALDGDANRATKLRVPPSDILVCGHTHEYKYGDHYTENGLRGAAVCPPWQGGRTSFGHRNSYDEGQVGCLIISLSRWSGWTKNVFVRYQPTIDDIPLNSATHQTLATQSSSKRGGSCSIKGRQRRKATAKR